MDVALSTDVYSTLRGRWLSVDFISIWDKQQRRTSCVPPLPIATSTHRMCARFKDCLLQYDSSVTVYARRFSPLPSSLCLPNAITQTRRQGHVQQASSVLEAACDERWSCEHRKEFKSTVDRSPVGDKRLGQPSVRPAAGRMVMHAVGLSVGRSVGWSVSRPNYNQIIIYGSPETPSS